MTITLPSLPGAQPLPEAVLFAFDDWAFPFRHHVQTHLIPGQKPRLVLEPGPPGAHDETVLYYGTVIRINDVFHMWYTGSPGSHSAGSGIGHGGPAHYLCYATSSDGITWEKPQLGLVEFNGSTRNNITDLPDPGMRPAAAILYEPEDSARPFKLAYESSIDGKARFCVAFSQNGLRWQPFSGNPVGPFLEMAGVIRWQGMYYVAGQGPLTAYRPARLRHMTIFASKDFEHWSPCGALGLDRSPDLTGPSIETEWNHVEEIHLGAGLWNRGNVIIGVYGQWHGLPSGDRRFLTMDLGLAISHDALHYTEPIPGFKLVPAREQPSSPPGDFPALMQGQGMENTGDHTHYWYSLWKGTQGTGVRIVRWERDRLGSLKPHHPAEAQVITCPIRIQDSPAQVAINASGLGPHSHLRVEVLDEGFRPLSGYAGEAGAVIAENGLHLPVRWPGADHLSPAAAPVRLAFHFSGIRPEDGHLHAVYLTSP